MANRPKPTALRELNGNAGKRPLPKGEPKPAVLQEAEAPEWLPPEARELWDELAPMLTSARVLTAFDRPALTQLCAAFALWRESFDFIQENGSTYESFSDAGRTFKRRPESIEEADRWKRFRLMLIEFGMTPAARSRVAMVGDDSDEGDPVAEWLNG